MAIQMKDRETTTQKILSLTLGAMLFFSPITLFVNVSLIYLFWAQISFDSLILYGAQLIMIVVALGIVLKRMKLNTMLFPLFMFLAFVVSAGIHPETKEYMFTSWGDIINNKIYWFFIYALPAFLFIRRIWDYDRLFRYMLNFAIVALLCSLGTLFVYLQLELQPGYMSFSYDLLLPTIVLLFGYFTKRKVVYLVGGLLGGITMFFCGARGPVLCLIAATVLYILFLSEKQSSKVLVILITMIVVVSVLVFWDPIMQLLYRFSDAIGINSRILEKIADGTLADDSGRSDVHAELQQQLNILGHGLYGDRVITGGRYAHNLFLELMVEFGLLIGSCLSMLMIVMLFHGFFTKDREKRLLFIAFFSASFIKLMMSSSYLSKEPAFYAMLGICVSCLIKDDTKPREHNQKHLLISLRYRGRR